MSNELEQTAETSPAWFYLSEEQVPSGPVTLDDLRERIRAGKTRLTDLVGCDGMPSWQFAFAVREVLNLPWKPPALQPQALPKPTSSGMSTGAALATGALAGAALGVGVSLAADALSSPSTFAGGPIGLEPPALRGNLANLYASALLPDDQYIYILGLLDGVQSGAMVPVRRSGSSLRNLQKLARRQHHQHHNQSNAEEGVAVLDAQPVEVADGEEVFDPIDFGPETLEDFDTGDDYQYDEDEIADEASGDFEGNVDDDGMDDLDADMDADLDGDLDADLDADLDVGMDADLSDVGGGGFDLGDVGGGLDFGSFGGGDD
jgi:hypothetical protein